jgi:hypothetical protein
MRHVHQVDEFIIGLELCPFARGARRGTRVAVCRAATPAGALDALAAELRYIDGACRELSHACAAA